MCLSMYFLPEKFLCLIYWIFSYFYISLQHAFCPSQVNKIPYGIGTKTICISSDQELSISSLKCFWYKPTHSCWLIVCYNAIYLTLDKYTPEHWLVPSSIIIMSVIVSFHAFCSYVWSEKKKCFMIVSHNFCLKEKEMVLT